MEFCESALLNKGEEDSEARYVSALKIFSLK